MNFKSIAILCLVVPFFACTKKQENKQQVVPQTIQNTPHTVGVLNQLQNEVTHRNAHELIWNSATENMNVKNYDAVKTGPASTGRIQYNDSTSVVLGEKTMLIILDREVSSTVERSVMEMPNGSIDGQLNPRKDKPFELVVRTSRGWIKARSDSSPEGTKFQASLSDKGELRVQSRSGSLTLVADNKEQVVKQNQEVKLEPLSPPTPAASKQKNAAVPKGNAFKILEPKDKQTVEGNQVKVKGILSGKMKAYLNGKELKSNDVSEFSIMVSLNPGINVLTFQVVGPQEDNVRYETREVIRK